MSKVMEIEKRAFPVEWREDSEGKIKGYSAVFNRLSGDLGGFKEKIAPGAFTKTLAESDVRALFNHDPNFVLGRTKSGTLELREDEKGLWMEVEPPDTQWARDLVTTIKRGDIDQQSFAFRTIKDTWTNEEGKLPIRTLNEVQLFDVSPVTYPAYPQTSVDVRALPVDAGIDWHLLSGIVARAARGIELEATDQETLEASIRTLQTYGPSEPETHSDAEPVVDHSEPEPVVVRPLGILVREWKLLELACR